MKSFSCKDGGDVGGQTSLLIGLVGSGLFKDGGFLLASLLGKVLIADNLRRKGLLLEDISDMCMICWRFRESIDHLFLHREVYMLYGAIFYLNVVSLGAYHSP